MYLESLLKKSSNCCSPGCYRWCIGCYQCVIVHLHVHVINSFLFFSFLASLWPRQTSGFNCILLSTCDRFALINITQWYDARNQTGSSRRSIPLPSFFAVQFTTFRIKAFTWSTWYHIHNHIISIGMDVLHKTNDQKMIIPVRHLQTRVFLTGHWLKTYLSASRPSLVGNMVYKHFMSILKMKEIESMESSKCMKLLSLIHKSSDLTDYGCHNFGQIARDEFRGATAAWNNWMAKVVTFVNMRSETNTWGPSNSDNVNVGGCWKFLYGYQFQNGFLDSSLFGCRQVFVDFGATSGIWKLPNCFFLVELTIAPPLLAALMMKSFWFLRFLGTVHFPLERLISQLYKWSLVCEHHNSIFWRKSPLMGIGRPFWSTRS